METHRPTGPLAEVFGDQEQLSFEAASAQPWWIANLKSDLRHISVACYVLSRQAAQSAT